MDKKGLVLTKEEQRFAEEHHDLIMVHLRVNHLEFEDWYDVLVFGYLRAVRTWFRRPEVRKWAFATIAKVKMRSAMVEQFRYENRAMRKGTVISIDAPLDEAEAATLSGLLASGEDVEEKAVFQMLFESLGSGLSQREKAVLRLQSEGYTEVEISRRLCIFHTEVFQAAEAIRGRCEEQFSEAVR